MKKHPRSFQKKMCITNKVNAQNVQIEYLEMASNYVGYLIVSLLGCCIQFYSCYCPLSLSYWWLLHGKSVYQVGAQLYSTRYTFLIASNHHRTLTAYICITAGIEAVPKRFLQSFLNRKVKFVIKIISVFVGGDEGSTKLRLKY